MAVTAHDAAVPIRCKRAVAVTTIPMHDLGPVCCTQLVELLKSTRARLGVKRDTAPALLEEVGH